MKHPRYRRRIRKRLSHLEAEKYQQRKSWFSFSLMILSWFIFFFIFFTIDAQLIQDYPVPNSYGPMLVAIGFLIASSLYFVTKHLTASLFWAVVICFIVLLRFQGLGQWWNSLLILSGGFLIDFIWISQGRYFRVIWQRLTKPAQMVNPEAEGQMDQEA